MEILNIIDNIINFSTTLDSEKVLPNISSILLAVRTFYNWRRNSQLILDEYSDLVESITVGCYNIANGYFKFLFLFLIFLFLIDDLLN